MTCDCGSDDLDIYDSDIDLPGEYIDFYVTCNDCGVSFKVETTLRIEKVSEI
ncbi:hypothetical protein LCGC14_2411450 [marine sediment metagenome]|uniref:DPH-type MB domain-containing protein n=1 Tax=marine sediment metagenome TaxID=412755 RepID=A0A0F9BSE5_9ZZZZ